MAPRPRNRWNLASLLTLVGGHVLAFLAGLVFAAIVIGLNPVTGDQAGWNVIAFVILPFSFVASSYTGIFGVLAAVFAAIGLRKFGANPFGIVMLVISILFSLKIFGLVQDLMHLPYYFSNL
jgi:hypothetical protein